MPINAREAYRELFAADRAPIGVDGLKGAASENQFKADCAYWYGTLSNAGTPGKTAFLHRMWALIWHGGLWMRPGLQGAWKSWRHTGMPVASCLSHGGRVMVQLTRDPVGDQVWKWLWGDMPPQPRGAATHGVKLGLYGVMPDGRPKAVAETKSGGKHFGVNIAGGGLGNTNPVSGTRIQDDGRHGHLYICYLAPTAETRGALLFGAEDSAPVDRARISGTQKATIGSAGSVVLLPIMLVDVLLDVGTGGGWARQPVGPTLRGALPRGQTGAYHAFGVSGKYSLTGGEKFKHLHKLQLDVPNGNDQMFVNPPVDEWLRLLDGTYRFNADWLGYPPPARSMSMSVVMPTLKQFKSATHGGRFHFRDGTLKAMDGVLEKHEKSTNPSERLRLRDQFTRLGFYYIDTTSDPSTLKNKVYKYALVAHEAPGADPDWL